MTIRPKEVQGLYGLGYDTSLYKGVSTITPKPVLFPVAQKKNIPILMVIGIIIFLIFAKIK